jgi:hypothetical protein
MISMRSSLGAKARRRLAAATAATALAAISTLASVQSAGAASSGPQRAAYFIDANGSLDVFGGAAGASWSQATPLTPAKLAPAGAPVAAVRGPSGLLHAYYVGNSGAVYESCGATTGSYTAVTGSGFAPAGSAISAVLAGGAVQIVVGTTGGFTAGSVSGIDDCGSVPHWWPLPHPWPWPWWKVGGTFTTVGYGNGQVGVFQAGNDGAVHALWGSASGQWQEATLSGTGVAAVGGGLAAVVIPSASSPVPGATSVFYAGRDGRVYVEQPALNGASSGPTPQPAAPQNPAPFGARIGALSAADGSTQTAYISVSGALIVTGTVSGKWQTPVQVAGAGFGTAGASVGVLGSAADDLDITYCGTPVPGHHHVGPTPPGPGWFPAGTAGLAIQGTIGAAVQ